MMKLFQNDRLCQAKQKAKQKEEEERQERETRLLKLKQQVYCSRSAKGQKRGQTTNFEHLLKSWGRV